MLGTLNLYNPWNTPNSPGVFPVYGVILLCTDEGRVRDSSQKRLKEITMTTATATHSRSSKVKAIKEKATTIKNTTTSPDVKDASQQLIDFCDELESAFTQDDNSN